MARFISFGRLYFCTLYHVHLGALWTCCRGHLGPSSPKLLKNQTGDARKNCKTESGRGRDRHFPAVWPLCRANASQYSSLFPAQAGNCLQEPKVPPLYGRPPFSLRHPQDNFSLQDVNSHPPTRDWRPPICNFCIESHRHPPPGVLPNLHFGGCQFALWRLKLSRGCLMEKGGSPKKGANLGFPNAGATEHPSQASFSGAQEAAPILEKRNEEKRSESFWENPNGGSQTGAWAPNIQRKSGGNPSWKIGPFRGKLGPFQGRSGLFGADRDQFLRTPYIYIYAVKLKTGPRFAFL